MEINSYHNLELKGASRKQAADLKYLKKGENSDRTQSHISFVDQSKQEVMNTQSDKGNALMVQNFLLSIYDEANDEMSEVM